MNGRPYPEGLDQRRNLLIAAGISPTLVLEKPPRGAAIDDMLDALAGLVVAKRIADALAQPFPNPPGRDAYGLPVAIWA